MTVKQVIIWSLVIGIFVIPTLYALITAIRNAITPIPTTTLDTSL